MQLRVGGRVVRPICWLIRYFDTPVERLALPATFLPHGSPNLKWGQALAS